MIERLAQIIYWAACGVAVVIVLIGAFNLFADADATGNFIRTLLVAVIVWIVGRTVLYMLTER